MIRDAADTVKKVSMELGGNAPCIIYDDANLEAALDACIPSKFGNCGSSMCGRQTDFSCTIACMTSLFRNLQESCCNLILGDGLNNNTEMGPLISSGRMGEVDAIVQEAISAGAKLEVGW